jgi:uncharacterized repeat protein (TIGR01451 family)
MRLATWSRRGAGPVVGTVLVAALLSIGPSAAAGTGRTRTFMLHVGQAGQAQANLQVWIRDNDPAGVGRWLTYAVRVRNLGPDTATNVWLRVPHPHNMQLTVVFVGGGWDVVDSDPHRTLLLAYSMAPGDHGSVRFIGHPREAGLAWLSATVRSDQPDPKPWNNGKTEATTIVEPPS